MRPTRQILDIRLGYQRQVFDKLSWRARRVPRKHEDGLGNPPSSCCPDTVRSRHLYESILESALPFQVRLVVVEGGIRLIAFAGAGCYNRLTTV